MPSTFPLEKVVSNTRSNEKREKSVAGQEIRCLLTTGYNDSYPGSLEEFSQVDSQNSSRIDNSYSSSQESDLFYDMPGLHQYISGSSGAIREQYDRHYAVSSGSEASSCSSWHSADIQNVPVSASSAFGKSKHVSNNKSSTMTSNQIFLKSSLIPSVDHVGSRHAAIPTSLKCDPRAYQNNQLNKTPRFNIDYQSAGVAKCSQNSGRFSSSDCQRQSLRNCSNIDYQSAGVAKCSQNSGRFSFSDCQRQSLHYCSNIDYQSAGVAKCSRNSGRFSSSDCQRQSLHNCSIIKSGPNDQRNPRERHFSSDGWEETGELTRGPRSRKFTSVCYEAKEDLGFIIRRDQYNLDDFPVDYKTAMFYVIKSFDEGDIHKSIKYDVWASTRIGNQKLDTAFCDAKKKYTESGCRCPVFLFFSVNKSGQFVGVAEMMGPVDFSKNMDFWQLDNWIGFFPVRWHIIKDVPSTHLAHIVLENNEWLPVTYSRDTQEVGLDHGFEMLKIFKDYKSKTSMLDDFNFYENREKLLRAKKRDKSATSDLGSSNAYSTHTCGIEDEISILNLTRV